MPAVAARVRSNGVVFDLFRPRLVHVHRPIVDHLSIHPCDGCLGFRIATHFDEGESAWHAGITIGDKFDAQHVPERFECGSNSLLGCVDSKIFHEDVLLGLMP